MTHFAFSERRLSRRSAIGRFSGICATAAIAASNLVAIGRSVQAAGVQSPAARIRKGNIMTASTPVSGDAGVTVVLVHGAFADSSSWNGVIPGLLEKGIPVVSAANPLRSVAGDADYVAEVLAAIPGPIVLVGHSYGGYVITNAAAGNSNVKALVYVAAFAPEAGESATDLAGRFPGSTLGQALVPFPLADGGVDLYIRGDIFQSQFAADVPETETVLMAATQRPVTQAALTDVSREPAWKTIPSWFIYGEQDQNIPAAAVAFMAERAGAKDAVEMPGASHVVMISQPQAVTEMILSAVNAVS